jgi:2-polyprenyl-6-methoxyphenol hydroxylase-like FAD-dependent oxidoreductase
MKVIIIGGGIGGLCTAIALQQYGHEVQVYERAETIGEVGAGLTLWSNAVKVLRTLGVADSVIAAGAKIEQSKLLTSTGEVLSSAGIEHLEERFGEPVIGIHRAVLHEILIRSLKLNTLKLAMPCVYFEQGYNKVTAHFANGEAEIADLLIGADGIHSVVRKQMMPNLRLRYSGCTAWRGVVETENEVALGLTSETWGRGQRFGIVRVDMKRVYWFATKNQPAGERVSGDERKAKLLRLFNDWHTPIRDLLEWTPPEAILQNDLYDIPPFTLWTQGHVTLLGDAAHPTTPNMGQGACMAIESAYVLSRCLKEQTDTKSALRRYEEQRHARTAWITNTSWSIGRVAQIEDPLLCALRDIAVKITPADLIQSNLRRAAGFDVISTK